jgi:toxin-antitoxin system PIN domain toxin
MLVDANLLLYATDAQSKFHPLARSWLLEQLAGSRRVGLPWQSLSAFLRLSTHPRVCARPLKPAEAWQAVSAWLQAPTAWIPQSGPKYAPLFGELLVGQEAAGNLVPDAQLAALALEHGLTVCSADSDFARFDGVRWENPLS